MLAGCRFVMVAVTVLSFRFPHVAAESQDLKTRQVLVEKMVVDRVVNLNPNEHN
jgi:hypothetical protein